MLVVRYTHSRLKAQYLYKLSIILSVGIILSLAIGNAPANAAATQITNNTIDDFNPKINAGRVVWSPHDGNDYEVFLYDIASGITAQLTNNNRDDAAAQIDNDKIIWYGETENSWEIFLYDIPTGTTTQVTNDTFIDAQPQISNGKIVWQHDDNHDTEIFLYDIASSTTTHVTNNSYFDNSPMISFGKVVWHRYDGADNEIFLYDIATGSTTQITNNNYDDNNPTINNGKIVWYGNDGTDFEVFLYDIATSTTTQITNNNLPDVASMINSDKIVWRNYDGTDFEIFIYNISTGITTQITNNNYDDADQNAFQINNGKIVWDNGASRVSNAEIYHYDIATGITSLVTNNNRDDRFPQIDNNGIVVWRSFDGQDWEIFLSSESVPINNTPTGSNVSYNENGVQLNFAQVTNGGTTTVTTSSTGSQPPGGFRLGTPPTYYNISTSATFTGNVEFCINYSSLGVQGNENNLKLMHFDDNAGWVNITSSLDTTNNIICGITTSFSAFALMTAPTIPDLINIVYEMNLHQGIENSLDSKLTAANQALSANNSGQQATAFSKLNAFINEVEAQRGNKLNTAQADELHVFAANLIKIIQGETLF